VNTAPDGPILIKFPLRKIFGRFPERDMVLLPSTSLFMICPKAPSSSEEVVLL